MQHANEIRPSPILGLLQLLPLQHDFRSIETLAWTLDAQQQSEDTSERKTQAAFRVAAYVLHMARTARTLLQIRETGVIRFVSGAFVGEWQDSDEAEARMVESQIAALTLDAVRRYRVEQVIVGSEPKGPCLTLMFQSGLRVAWGGSNCDCAMLFPEG